MLLSKTCINAIQAALEIADLTSKQDQRYVPIRIVADAIGISHHFLGKIAQGLVDKGIMTSFRGPNGGVGLLKPPDQVFLLDIVKATDGLGVFEKCVLGLPDCCEDNPCPLHRAWSRSREALLEELSRESLAYILQRRKSRAITVEKPKW